MRIKKSCLNIWQRKSPSLAELRLFLHSCEYCVRASGT